MLQAILVTELERAIIEKIRSGVVWQSLALNCLFLPDTEEVRKYYERILEREENVLRRTKELERHIKYNEERLKEYREAGYREPLEFGTGKTVPFLRSLPYGK